MTWMSNETIEFLLEGTAEAMDYPDLAESGIEWGPMLEEAIAEYEEALDKALPECLRSAGVENPEAVADELIADGDASYAVLMTLRGEGVGIWDGRWDAWLTDAQIESAQQCLERKLRKFADVSGSGSVNDAFMNTVFEQAEAGDELESNKRMRRNAEGMPPGWAGSKRSGEYRWFPAHDYEYVLLGDASAPVGTNRWGIAFFTPGARTADPLTVGALPGRYLSDATLRRKLAPEGRHASSVASFVHAFDAADAAQAHWRERAEMSDNALRRGPRARRR